MTRGDVSNTLEVGGENRRRPKDWDGNRDKFCVLEMGFNGFQLELGGLSENCRGYGASHDESTKNHLEMNDGKGSGSNGVRGKLNVFPTTFQVITTPPLKISGDHGDDYDAGRTVTTTLWPRV